MENALESKNRICQISWLWCDETLFLPIFCDTDGKAILLPKFGQILNTGSKFRISFAHPTHEMKE